MILDEHGRPIDPSPPTDGPILQVLTGDKNPDPVFYIETRQSAVDGWQHWAVLRYKEHVFEEALPQTVLNWDEHSRDIFMLPVMRRLQLQLRPIIMAEDVHA
jgi:hypothetical protein